MEQCATVLVNMDSNWARQAHREGAHLRRQIWPTANSGTRCAPKRAEDVIDVAWADFIDEGSLTFEDAEQMTRFAPCWSER